MSQTTILEERWDDFEEGTGVIHSRSRRAVSKSKLDVTDEFIKVSKYLNTIFAYKNIPMNLVPISLLMAQHMEFKTNRIYLLKPLKLEFAEMLDVSLDRVNKLIKECQKYGIIRPVARATYEVNSYLYATGNFTETRELQAHIDFMSDELSTVADQKDMITGKVVRKAVTNAKSKKKKYQIPGQMTLELEEKKGEE